MYNVHKQTMNVVKIKLERKEVRMNGRGLQLIAKEKCNHPCRKRKPIHGRRAQNSLLHLHGTGMQNCVDVKTMME